MSSIRKGKMSIEYELLTNISMKNFLKLIIKELHTTSKPLLKYLYNDLKDKSLMVCIQHKRATFENKIKLNPRIGKSQFRVYVHNMKLFNLMNIYLKEKGQIVKMISVVK
jgi:hypothetical protein